MARTGSGVRVARPDAGADRRERGVLELLVLGTLHAPCGEHAIELLEPEPAVTLGDRLAEEVSLAPAERAGVGPMHDAAQEGGQLGDPAAAERAGLEHRVRFAP